MTHVVCEPCQDCKYTDCVTVCPVECFYQDDTMLYIDPAECIDCEDCVKQCPVEAICAEASLPSQWQCFTELNAAKTQALKDAGANSMSAEKQTPKKGPGCTDPSH